MSHTQLQVSTQQHPCCYGNIMWYEIMKEGGGLRLLGQQQTILPRYDLMLGMGGRVAKPGYTTAESLHVNIGVKWC